MDGALYFSSGPGEQKSRNLAANRQCAATTGCNTWDEGFDIVLHGEAAVARDPRLLQQVAPAWTSHRLAELQYAATANEWVVFHQADGRVGVFGFDHRPAHE